MGAGALLGLLALVGPALAQDAGAAAQAKKPAVAATAAPKAPDVQAPAAADPDAKAAAAAPDVTGGRKPAKASHPVKGSQGVEAAEQRYQNYLEREKSASEASLAKQRSKLEDKYKGFVRTVKPKGAAAPDAAKGGQ
jgi:hypothetical protein